MSNNDNQPESFDAPARIPLTVMLSLLSVILIMLLLYSASAGAINISMGDTWRAVMGKLSGDHAWYNGLGGEYNGHEVSGNTVVYVVNEVRLPRVFAAAAVGAALALAGVMVQAVLLNPLAEPYTLGISAGAAFGASLAILLSLAGIAGYSISLFAFMGAAGALLAVLSLSTFEGRIVPVNLVLAGIIVSAILSAGIGFMKYMADENATRIIFWLMGSFSEVGWPQVFLVFSGTLVALAGGLFFARDLNILAIGTSSAMSLGVNTSRVRLAVLLVACMATAASVSAAGIIAFVGLIVPHFARMIMGPDNRGLLLVSALLGAILLLGADTLTRAVLPHEVPVGVITSLIGGPVFCLIFRARSQEVFRVQ